MAEFPSLSLFTDAFIGDTSHLTAAQTGAYIMLLLVAWRSKDCKLPNDDKILARIARMDGRQWAANRDAIMSFWHKDESGRLYQQRLLEERKFVYQLRTKNVQAGLASALKRKERHSTGVASTLQPNANITSTPIPIPISKKESKISESKIKEILDSLVNAQNLWNDLAEKINLSKIQRLTDARKAQLQKRLDEAGGLEGWKTVLKKIEQSSFLRGGGAQGWKANFDFVLKQSNFTKILEGNYDDKKPANDSGRKKSFAEMGIL
jgi:uncharacterized protein YdaU (DUF1376 family)